MILQKKRIRSINSLASILKNDEKFCVGVNTPSRFKPALEKAGFTSDMKNGESVLPAPAFGPISLFNAEGKYIKHKDRPMETAYRTAEWHWKEWHGQYDRVDQSKFVDVPYKRYPRSFVNPPSKELTISAIKDKKILVSSVMTYSGNNEQEIVHTINLILEIFGECEFFKDDLSQIIKVPIVRLNWKILPPGQMPWAKLEQEVDPIIKNAPQGNQPFIYHRLEKINKFHPDFVAVGRGGFRGYVIFGFKGKSLYALESIYYGNATYIFGEQWEALSKKTKAEILNEKLQKNRIIHLVSWDGKINSLLKS